MRDWQLPRLQAELALLLPDITLQALEEVGSTNTELLERARQNAGSALLVAERQTQGRGRQGRSWLSEPGASLAFSVSLPLAPKTWDGLSLVVGWSLAQALQPWGPQGQAPEHQARLMLKWPNDLWLLQPQALVSEGRKLGGILIETTAAAASAPPQGHPATQRQVVVGVGLNVRELQHDADGNSALYSQGRASISQWQPQADAVQVLHQVAMPLVQALLNFQAQGFEPFRRAYEQRDLLRGQRVQTQVTGAAQRAQEGVCQGYDESGALLLQTSDGVQRIRSGEVSIRPI